MAIFLARQKGSGGTGNLQTKTFTAGTSSATYTPDSGYVGFDEVTVDPTPSETKTQAAGTSNIDVTPTNGKLLSKVTITPQQHSDSFTPTANLQGASGNANDMGASHNKRYINTSGMIIPSGNKAITSNGTNIDVSSYSTASVSVSPNIQTKSAGTQTPSANWSGSTTNSVTINKDSNYDGMSSVTFNCPMIRDENILQYSTTSTPSTVYRGDTAVSNSKTLMRVAPYKDGMVYTGSYLYVDPTEGGWSKPSGTKSISSNGTYDVTSYASVSVSVSGSTTHTGTYYPSANTSSNDMGVTHSYRYVNTSGMYSVSGTKSISLNGTYDVSSYASVSVSVSSSAGSLEVTKTLWSNSSPSSTFAAQTISLSASMANYSYIGIKWRASTSSTTWLQAITGNQSGMASDSGSGGNIVLGYNTGSTKYIRYCYRVSNTSLGFKACYQHASSTTSNGYCIPIAVYGMDVS